MIKNIYLPLPDISEHNVIGSRVGLRPCRKNGIRIEAEHIDKKFIIHNYGYCGMGISLSWGGAYEVLNILENECQKNPSLKNEPIALIGAGVIGLSTAYVLLTNGYKVNIYAKEFPPYTTSDIAGGLWGVYQCSQPQDKNLFDRIQHISFNTFSELARSHALKGVDFIDIYTFYGSDPGFTPELLAENLIPEPEKVYVHFDHQKPRESIKYATLRIDTSVYMPNLFEHIKKFPGIKIKTITIENIDSLKEQVIINCSGLGARKIFNDNNMRAIKGQLVLLKPQANINFMLDVLSAHEKTAIFLVPQKKYLIVGVSFEFNSKYDQPDTAMQELLLHQMQTFLRQ